MFENSSAVNPFELGLFKDSCLTLVDLSLDTIDSNIYLLSTTN